jgi:hypothetical protein
MDYPKTVPGVGLVGGKFVDEDAVAGTVGSLIPSEWGNSVTDEILALQALAGLVADEADKAQMSKAINILLGRRLSQVSSGLKGSNNAASPTTKFDFSADLLTLRNPTSGNVSVWSAVAAITVDTAVAGPALNGRDRATAFPASSWLHLYAVGDETAIKGGVFSLSAPSAGPTLPAGCTEWKYVGPIYFNASSQLMRIQVRGDEFSYVSPPNILSTAAGPTSQASISMAAAVPPNAKHARLMINNGVGTNSTSVAVGTDFYLGAESGLAISKVHMTAVTAGVVFWNGMERQVPNVNQNLYYWFGSEINAGNISARWADIDVTGYTVSNGG